MRKPEIIIWCCLMVLAVTTAARAETESGIEAPENQFTATSAWEVSLSEWDVNGWFDYLLFYPQQNQLLSKVSFPQNQKMTMIKAKYTPPEKDFFFTLQYGQTGKQNKDRGFDADWTNQGYDDLTFYGDFDAYGDQSLVMVDFGKVLSNSETGKTSVFLGFVQQKTTNEIKNAVYYIANGSDIGSEPQADLGSTLDGKFQGLGIGLEQQWRWSKWTLTGSAGLSALETKAYGHWANHDPAWNWVDTGYTVGWRLDLGVAYALTRNIRAELGYFTSYAKNYFDLAACDETITGEGMPETGLLLSDRVILRYRQEGLRLGLKVLF